MGWIEPHRGAPKTIGMDIGLTTIRAVTLEHRANHLELVDVHNYGVSEEPLKNLSSTLARIFRGASFDNTHIHAAISGASTLVRYISLPRMSEKELRSSMMFEAEKYIPYHINEVVLDCHLLGEGQDERGKKLTKGILAVCKKDAVQQLGEACRELGAPLSIIDAPPLAIINAFQFNVPDAAKQVVALLHIGYNTSNLSILFHGEPVFTREISFGGADITQAISKGTGLDKEEAEKRKMHFMWAKDGDLHPMLAQTVRYLAQEVRLSFNYFENHVPGAEAPERAYLSGATAQLDHFVELLQDELDTPTSNWDPTARIKIGPDIDTEELEKIKPGLAIGIGLAIR